LTGLALILLLKSYNNLNSASSKDFIFNYLKTHFHITPLQACAILGNIAVETGETFSSQFLQNKGKTPEYILNYNCKDGKGWGILQWTYHLRKNALYDFAEEKNKLSFLGNVKNVDINNLKYNVGDLIVQLEFFNSERVKNDCKSDWDLFVKQKNIIDMTEAFCRYYERPSIPHMDRRIAKATIYAKDYGLK
jgi:hypothetical protein